VYTERRKYCIQKDINILFSVSKTRFTVGAFQLWEMNAYKYAIIITRPADLEQAVCNANWEGLAPATEADNLPCLVSQYSVSATISH
jgi:hypothetical protein